MRGCLRRSGECGSGMESHIASWDKIGNYSCFGQYRVFKIIWNFWSTLERSWWGGISVNAISVKQHSTYLQGKWIRMKTGHFLLYLLQTCPNLLGPMFGKGTPPLVGSVNILLGATAISCPPLLSVCVAQCLCSSPHPLYMHLAIALRTSGWTGRCSLASFLSSTDSVLLYLWEGDTS